MAQKVITGGNLSYRLRPGTISSLFADLSSVNRFLPNRRTWLYAF